MTYTKSLPRAANAIDKIVGENIRRFRLANGLSQSDLGHASGVTFQQIQKYEKGSNRVGASRLWEFSQVLKVNLLQFYEGLIPASEINPSLQVEFFKEPAGCALATAFMAIDDSDIQAQVLAFCEVLSKAQPQRAA